MLNILKTLLFTFIYLSISHLCFSEDSLTIKKEYYPNGHLRTEYQISADGIKNGFEKIYNPDGNTISVEQNYQEGKLWGHFIYFYENGKIYTEGTFQNGEPDGELKHYFDDGTLWRSRKYKTGSLLNEDGTFYEGTLQTFDQNKKLLAETQLVHGRKNGFYKEYYPNGKVSLIENYENNLVEGTSQAFDDTGNLYAKYSYHNGKQDGLTQEYYPSGKIQGEYEFKDGINHGFAKHFSPTGILESSATFENGNQIGKVKNYFPNGKEKGEGFIIVQNQNWILFGVLYLFVFIFSITCHEAAHAWASYKMGDATAYEGGQVSLNPLPHIKREPIGTILMPILSYITRGSVMGWASAPYNPQWAIEYPKKAALMALAGPVANLLLAIITGITIKILIVTQLFMEPETINFSSIAVSSHPGFFASLAALLSIFFSMNILMCFFNLLPLPPLDGSAIIMLFMNHEIAQKYMHISHQPIFSFIGIFVAWKFFDYLFSPIFYCAISILFPGIF